MPPTSPIAPLIQSAYLLLIGGAALMALLLAFIALRFRDLPGAQFLLIFMLSIVEVCTAFLGTSLAASPEVGFVWTRLRFLGIQVGIVCYCLFVTTFVGWSGWVNRKTVILLLVIPALTQLVLWSGQANGLFFKDWVLIRYEIIAVEQIRFTGWFWIHAAYLTGLSGVALILLLRFWQRSKAPQRNQAGLLIAGALMNFFAGSQTAYLPGIIPLNPLPLSLFITGLIGAWVMFRQRLLDIIPVAYDTVFMKMPNAAVVLNKRNVVVQINPGAEAILNQPRQALIGKALDEIPLLRDLVERASDQPEGRLETLLRATGATRLYNVLVSQLSASRGTVVGRLITLVDITSLRQAEEALRASEARLRFLLANAPVIIMSYSANHERSQVDTFFSDNATRLIGYPPEVYANWQAWASKIHPDDIDAVTRMIRTVGGGLERKEYRFLHPDGTYHWMRGEVQLVRDSAGNPLEYVGYAIDVTDRKQAEEALRESEARYRQLLENAPVALLVLDLETLDIRYLNPATRLVLPDLPERVSGEFRMWSSWLSAEDQQKLRERVHLSAQRVSLPPGEYAARLPNGETMYLTTRAVLTHYDGRPALLVSLNNITDMKRALQAEARQRQFTEALVDVALTINSTLHFDEVLGKIFDSLRKIIVYDSANIMLIDNGYTAVVGQRGYPAARQPIIQTIRISVDETFTFARMIDTHEPLLIEDTTREPRWKSRLDSSVRSYLGTPIIVGADVIGFINVDSLTEGTFSQQDAIHLKAFAMLAAVALTNAREFEQAYEKATSAERQRLARDLHDSVSQILFSANITAEALAALNSTDPSFVRQSLPELARLTKGALSEMRTLLIELRPDALRDTDLSILLMHLANSLQTHITGTVVYTVEGELLPLPFDVKVCLYRLTQEALNNITKHAKANCVTITLHYDKYSVTLTITDDGKGFQMDAVSSERFGVRMMRERAALAGVAFTITSAINEGTTIEASWDAAE